MNPAELQILIAKLTGVAEEMSAVLRRSAFSPNIKERADCSSAVFDSDGHALAQANNIPVHLGSMPDSVAAVIAHFGNGLGDGEHAIVNDPFAGGTHLNDITVVTPCYSNSGGDLAASGNGGDPGRLVGWVANRAHHADVGGAAPGSMPADATEIQQEGLRIPPARLTDDIRRILLANSRTPLERSGDLEAQVGANRIGAQRLAELADEPFSEVLAHGRRLAGAVLDGLAVGEWSAEDVIDSTGPSPDQQRPAVLRCTVRVEPVGDGQDAHNRLVVDFAGTDRQRIGNTNAVRSVTESAVGFAIRSALAPDLPANAGVMERIRIDIPQGSILAANPPAAVGAGNVEVSQRVADVVLRALAQAVPGRVGAAGQGTMNNILLGGTTGWVYYETVAGGQGGRPPNPEVMGDRPHPGMSGVHTAMTNTDQVDYRSVEPRPGQSGIHTAMTNTRNTPIEALERAFPLRVLRYRLRRGSGGAGWAPGGEGIERDLQVLEDAMVSLITERRVSQPWGLAGGEPGAVGENWLLPGGDEARAERLPDKCTIQLRVGDVLRMLTPGGGGWGARQKA